MGNHECIRQIRNILDKNFQKTTMNIISKNRIPAKNFSLNSDLGDSMFTGL